MTNPFRGNPFGEIDPSELAAGLSSLGIGDIGTFTVATLPAPSATPMRTAWVTDLWSDLPVPGGRVVSEGGFWKPIRPLAVASPVASTMTLTALLNAPTQLVTGTIGTGVTRTITLGTTNAYPGARFRVLRKATGLGALIVGATGLSINAWQDYEFDGSAWVQTASGGLL